MALLGVDFGRRRVGLAVSESGVIATPLEVLTHGGDLEVLARQIARIADRFGVQAIVLGIPRRPGDAGGERSYHELAERLRQESCREVVLWDEAYSTVEARDLRRQRVTRSGRSRAPIDHEAAAVMLQRYLDQRGRNS